MVALQGEYCFALNSHDKYDPELPLVKTKANGGTMVLWKVCHDPYISVHPVSSPSILPIIFNPPQSLLSIHVAVYLPTHGQDRRIEELSSLEVCLQELNDLFQFFSEEILMLMQTTQEDLFFLKTSASIWT